jgi:hypothetical protein
MNLDLKVDALLMNQARERERIIEEGRQRLALENAARNRSARPTVPAISPPASTLDPIPVLVRFWRGWNRPRREPSCAEAIA